MPVDLRLRMQRLGREGLELQVGPLHVAVEKHQAREIHRAFAAEDLVLVELEVHAQPLDNLRIGAGFNLQAHRVALAAVVQLHADGFEQRARFFLFEVEVGIARDAERRARPAPRSRDTCRRGAARSGPAAAGSRSAPSVGGQADKARQRARHRDHAQHLRAGAAALGAQQQRQAERLVQHARKRMRRVDGDRRQQRIDFALKVAAGQSRAASSLSSSHSSRRMPCLRSSGSSCSFQQRYCAATKL